MKQVPYGSGKYLYEYNLNSTFIYEGTKVLMVFWGKMTEQEIIYAISGYEQGQESVKVIGQIGK